MKTDDQRLQLVLDFANIPDIEEANQRELRSNLSAFLGYTMPEDSLTPETIDKYFSDLIEGRWPDTVGGSGIEVSAHIDVSVSSLHIYAGLDVREGFSDFLGFGESVAVPVKVLQDLQNRTRGLINDYLGDEDADRRRHATWVERGPGTEERRAVGERKLPKDTMFHVNELADQLGGTITVVGRGASLRTHIDAEPEVAFQWIVLLLINGEPDIRICARSKCQNFFVSARPSKKYCSDRCGHAERNARQYADPEKRKRKNALRRAKRASERR